MYNTLNRVTKLVLLLYLTCLFFMNLILHSSFHTMTFHLHEKELEKTSEHYSKIFTNYLTDQSEETLLMAQSDIMKMPFHLDDEDMEYVSDSLRLTAQGTDDTLGLQILNLDHEIIATTFDKPIYSRSPFKEEDTTTINLTYTDQNEAVLTYTIMICDQGIPIGYLERITSLDFFINDLTYNSLGNLGALYLVDFHLQSLPIYTPGSDLPVNPIVNFVQTYNHSNFQTGYFNRSEKLFVSTPVELLNARVVATHNISTINQTVTFFNQILLLCDILFLALLAIVLYIQPRITKPLKLLETTVKQANTGDFSVRCSYDKNNEFGFLSRNINHLLNTIEQNYSTIHQSQQQLIQSEERYRVVLEGVNDITWDWNVTTNEFFASPKWSDLFLKPIPEQMNIELFLSMFDDENTRSHFHQKLLPLLSLQEAHFDWEFSGNQGQKWIGVKAISYHSVSDQSLRIMGTFTDITSKKQSEDKLLQLAYQDQLTGLHNRYSIEKMLNRIISISTKESRHAVILLDLDDFKTINDSMGHHYGDRALNYIGRILKGLAHSRCHMGRFGGDEFFIILNDYTDIQEVEMLIKEIAKALDAPVTIEGMVATLHSSIGISLYPEHGLNTSALMKFADIAMYEAKQQGKNQYKFFNSTMYDSTQRQLIILNMLQSAIEDQYLTLVYQPIYRLSSHQVCSLEVLCRMYSPDIGYISPDEFIPIAEEKKLIIPIGYWIIEESCRRFIQLQEAGYGIETIAINISIKQLEEVDFVEQVQQIFQKVGIEPHHVEFEITESVLINCFQKAIEKLVQLKELGVIIALDDFGAGYSSFNYLGTLPIDIVKVDRLFVERFLLESKFFNITEAIVNLANQLKLETIAEGIETEEQYDKLRQLGFDYGQGYYMNKPLSYQNLLKQLEQNP